MDPRIVHRKKVVVARAQRDAGRTARELQAARAALARREPDEVLDIVADRIAQDLARLEPRAGALARFLARCRGKPEPARSSRG